MISDHLIFLSVPGLRPDDIDRRRTPTLYQWAHAGALAELTPTFPCVTSCVQATMWTGLEPRDHGVIANGFFHRDRRAVEFWVGHNDVIAGEQVWDQIRTKRPRSPCVTLHPPRRREFARAKAGDSGAMRNRARSCSFTSAIWHGQNIKGAGADFIVTPAPIHEPDGTTKLWCYSKPDGLYRQIVDSLGHFPLQHYWGPLANIESTRWILNAACWLNERREPNFHWIYIPHLDYAAQKFGPNSTEAKAALIELDRELEGFAAKIASSPVGDRIVYMVAGEYALTDVTRVVYPNRVLREAGLLEVREEGGTELIDLAASRAFAMVDHQFAHVYLESSDPRMEWKVCEAFRGVPGVAGVYPGDARKEIGLAHQRSGEVVLVADDDSWFAYYWWLDDAAAPAFARTVDIHSKPGYDPVELFFDPTTKRIPLDATVVRGSHGAPARTAQQKTALICSVASATVQPGRCYRDRQMKRMILEMLNLYHRAGRQPHDNLNG